MTDLSAVDELATWSPWLPFEKAIAEAPLTPGVYMAREAADREVVYVGMAGERDGRGIRSRLSVYRTGKGAVSGLGEAAMDRALGDVEWLRTRVAEVEAGNPMRTKLWARAAIERASLELRWAITADRSAAAVLERTVIEALRLAELWNRAT